MWQVVYIIVFAVLAILAIANLLRNLMVLGSGARNPQQANRSGAQPFGRGGPGLPGNQSVPHPELLDQNGEVIREPLLVMRSISVKDAREQLDALYNGTDDTDETAGDRD